MAAEPVIRDKETHTFRQYEDGDHVTTDFEKRTGITCVFEQAKFTGPVVEVGF